MTISSTSKSPLSNSQNGEQLSKARRYWRLFYTNISVEPLLFLYGLGFSISQSISPVLYMDKICLVGSPLFGNASQTWDKEICDHMDTGQYPHVQTYVQTVSTKSWNSQHCNFFPISLFKVLCKKDWYVFDSSCFRHTRKWHTQCFLSRVSRLSYSPYLLGHGQTDLAGNFWWSFHWQGKEKNLYW